MNFINEYEVWLDEILPALIKDDKAVFVDIGANIGQTLLKVLPRFPEVQYFAIEPNPACVDYLTKLCKINDFARVKLLATALASTEGETKLMTRFADDLLATTTPGFRKYTRYADEMKVSQTTGDKLFEKLAPKRLDVIKIDVEGGEADVVGGLVKTIEKYQPKILCEILPVQSIDESVTKLRQKNAARLISTMLHLEYQIVNISTKAIVREVEDLSESLESSNYLMTPKNNKHQA